MDLCLSLQIADMLQKEPELRPSADEIFTSRVPQLLQRYQNEDDHAIFSDDEQELDTRTQAKWVGAIGWG